jgi:hypothetical protein
MVGFRRENGSYNQFLKIKAGLMPIVSLHTSAYYGGGVDLLPENSAGLN